MKKRNYLFSAENFRFYHDYAKRHVPDILKKIQKCKGGIDNFKSTNEVPITRMKYNESELFCEPQIVNSIFQVSFRYGLGAVRIDAFLPVSYEDKMSCLLSFKQLYQTNLFITYDEKDIKDYLFSGYKTDICSQKRRWCNCYELSANSPLYEINLPNIKLQASRDELLQMSKICDKLFEEYQLQDLTINNILGTTNFVKNKDNKFAIFSIRNDILQQLFLYMRNHQYDMDLSTDNIFHLTSDPCMFYLHQNLNSNENAGIYACISLEPSGNYHTVLWTPGYTGSEYDKMLDFDNIIKWTAIYTYERFLDEFIPKAIINNNKNNFLFSYKKRKIINREHLLNSKYILSFENE